MAIPSLPTALNTNDVINNSWVDAVRDVLELVRDTRPMFKGQASGYSGGGSNELLNNTTTTFGFGEGGSFMNTPDINVGGWDVNSGDSDPESLVVPEAGIYLVTIWAQFSSDDFDERRQTVLLVNGSAATASRARVDASPSSTTNYSTTVLVDLAANDDLDIEAYQNSGSTLTLTTYLTAVWMQST